MNGGCSFRVLMGDMKGTVLPIDFQQEVTFGRDPRCDICLPESNTSRRHASLEWDDHQPVMRDLGSRNGVFVNGTQIERATLHHFDTVVIGDHVLRFEEDAGAPSGAFQMLTLPEDAERDQGSSSAALPALASYDEYAKLFSALLSIQRILSRDADDSIPRALDALFRVMPATRLSLLEVDDNQELHQSYTITPQGPTEDYIGRSFAQRVLNENRPIKMEEIDSSVSAEQWSTTLQEQNVRSILGVPVERNDHPVAVLLCDNQREPGALRDHHLEILTYLAKSLEQVFERESFRELRREQIQHDQQVTAARRVQEQLFTKDTTPRFENSEWCAFYQPALQLGGDFYDYHRCADGSCLWMAVDVSGKGLSASLVVSMIKAFSRTLMDDDIHPVPFLIGLDRLLSPEMPPTMFITAAAWRLTPDGALDHAAIGHPPFLLQRRDGGTEYLHGTKGVIGLGGVFDLAQILSANRTQLAPGDRLCCFSDGVLDAGLDHLGRGGFGEDGIEQALCGTAGMPLMAALTHIQQRLREHQGRRPQYDDITLILGQAGDNQRGRGSSGSEHVSSNGF